MNVRRLRRKCSRARVQRAKVKRRREYATQTPNVQIAALAAILQSPYGKILSKYPHLILGFLITKEKKSILSQRSANTISTMIIDY